MKSFKLVDANLKEIKVGDKAALEDYDFEITSIVPPKSRFDEGKVILAHKVSVSAKAVGLHYVEVNS